MRRRTQQIWARRSRRRWLPGQRDGRRSSQTWQMSWMAAKKKAATSLGRQKDGAADVDCCARTVATPAASLASLARQTDGLRTATTPAGSGGRGDGTRADGARRTRADERRCAGEEGRGVPGEADGRRADDRDTGGGLRTRERRPADEADDDGRCGVDGV
jgi:hypothetical protein